MPFLRVLNFFLGFSFLFIASSSGFFLAKESSYALLEAKEHLSSWVYVLQKSAHAHTNLFGLLHVAFGVSLTSSSLSFRFKFFQTLGFFSGSLAMSVLLFTRSYLSSHSSLSSLLSMVSAFFLACSLLALATHTFGLLKKLISHS